ncbi:MAG TPA: hypothetical protein VGF16_06245 [Bryobacteraceae bacterium]|jgi:hypothetical protein
MKALAIVVIALISAGCSKKSKPETKAPAIGWRFIESWSGQGDMQTDSFDIPSGAFRIKWETTHESSPGAGFFRVMVHSGVSSRPITLAVDHRGVGKDVAYVRDDPRPYFLVITSKNVDWSVRVEEGVVGQPY